MHVNVSGLRKHDVCFLLTCKPKAKVGTKFNIRKPFKEQIDISVVRGCEIEGMLDSEGMVIEEYGMVVFQFEACRSEIRWLRISLDIEAIICSLNFSGSYCIAPHRILLN